MKFTNILHLLAIHFHSYLLPLKYSLYGAYVSFWKCCEKCYVTVTNILSLTVICFFTYMIIYAFYALAFFSFMPVTYEIVHMFICYLVII